MPELPGQTYSVVAGVVVAVAYVVVALLAGDWWWYVGVLRWAQGR